MRYILRPLIYSTLALCALGGYYSVSNWLRADMAVSWPDTSGVILESDVVEIRSAGDVMTTRMIEYEAFVRYRYRAGGAEHVGTTISIPNPPHFPDRESADRYLSQYPARAKTAVYYDPGNPADSVLEPGGGGSPASAAGGLLLFAVIAAFCLYGLKIIPSGEEDYDQR